MTTIKVMNIFFTPKVSWWPFIISPFCLPLPPAPHSQTQNKLPLSLQISLHFLEFCINGNITLWIVFCLASFTGQNYFALHIHYWTHQQFVFSLLLNRMSSYGYITIWLFIYLLRDFELSLSTIIQIKVVWTFMLKSMC